MVIALWPRHPVMPSGGQPVAGQPSAATSASESSQDPKNDTTYFATSSDPKVWPTGTKIADHASVPDILELSQPVGAFKTGDLLVYYVDFATFQTPGQETLSLLASHDHGKSWDAKQTVTIADKPNKGAPVDPSIVQLPDGQLQLYFFGSEVAGTGGDPAKVAGAHHVYSATSTDGLAFTAESGSRFAADNLTDPEVVHYHNQWYMYYSLGTMSALAVSDDGLMFTQRATTGTDIGGVPGAVVIGDSVRLFGCGQGIASALSPDGVTFHQDTTMVFATPPQGIACDPSIVRSADGSTYFIVYKFQARSPSATSTQRPSSTAPAAPSPSSPNSSPPPAVNQGGTQGTQPAPRPVSPAVTQ